jgi:hypothetical protein
MLDTDKKKVRVWDRLRVRVRFDKKGTELGFGIGLEIGLEIGYGLGLGLELEVGIGLQLGLGIRLG